jgi:Holliday junction resolvasome RuvABC endonuclease subunit
MKATLALDLGSKTGWATREIGGRVTSGVQEFSLQRGDSAGMRFIRFNRWLREMLADVKPSLVVYEKPHMRGGYATDLLVGFMTRIQEACVEQGIEYEGVHSLTLKKATCGTGKADKAKMIEWAAEHYSRDARNLDDNEADALCLLAYVGREP